MEKTYTITLDEKTVNQIKEIVNYKNTSTKLKNDFYIINEEDLIIGSIKFWMERIFNYNLLLDKNQSLGKPYQLKNKFKDAMKQKGMQLKDLSEKTDIHSGNLSRILNNKVQPSLDYFLRIWVALDCPEISYVLYREETEN